MVLSAIVSMSGSSIPIASHLVTQGSVLFSGKCIFQEPETRRGKFLSLVAQSLLSALNLNLHLTCWYICCGVKLELLRCVCNGQEPVVWRLRCFTRCQLVWEADDSRCWLEIADPHQSYSSIEPTMIIPSLECGVSTLSQWSSSLGSSKA